jgi:hypothetical protein
VWDPLLPIPANTESGLTLLLAAFGWLLWHRSRDVAATRDTADWLGLFFWAAVIQFIVVGLLMGLRPLPRYFIFSFIPALMLLSVWLTALWQRGRGAVAGAVGVALVGSGLVLTDLTNRDPLFAARTLLAGIRENPESRFYAPEYLCRRARLLAQQDGKGQDSKGQEGKGQGSMGQGSKRQGAPMCHSLTDADTVVIAVGGPVSADDFPGFDVSARLQGGATVTGRLLQAAGVDGVLPLPARLFRAAPTVLVLRRQRP